jgi:hypothetical protein
MEGNSNHQRKRSRRWDILYARVGDEVTLLLALAQELREANGIPRAACVCQ